MITSKYYRATGKVYLLQAALKNFIMDAPSGLLHAAFFLWNSSQAPPTSGLPPTHKKKKKKIYLLHLKRKAFLHALVQTSTSIVAEARSCTVGHLCSVKYAALLLDFTKDCLNVR